MKVNSPCLEAIATNLIGSAAAACYMNLKDETVQILKTPVEPESDVDQELVRDIHHAIAYYADRFIHPDDRNILYDYLDPHYVRRTLKVKEDYTFDLREVHDGRSAVIRGTVMRGEDDSHAVILFKNTSKSFSREQEAQKLIDNITTRFNIVYLVDMATDSVQILRMDSHMRESKGHFSKFTQAREFFLSKVVHFSDREYMRRELDYSTIRNRLANCPSYNVEYRILKDNITMGGEMKVTSIEGSRIIIGMGGSDLDLVLRHMQQKRYDEYFALFVIDLDTEMLKVMKTSPWYKTGDVGQVAPYTTVIQAFANTLEPEPKDFFMKLSDIGYVRRELAHEDKRSYTYKSNLVTEANKWVSVVSYVTIRHEDGTPAEFTLGFSLVDSFERQSKEAALSLREDMHTIGGLAGGYLALYYINIDEGTFKVYSIDGKRLQDTKKLLNSDKDCFSAFYKFANSNAVHPDDSHLFMELNVESVRKRLAHSKKFSIRFRRNYGNGYLWSEMDIFKYEAVNEQANALIIGFAEVDEMVRRQIEQEEQQRKNIEIIEALASDYSSVYYFDFEKSETTPITMNDELGMRVLEIFRCSESFDEAYRTCVDTFVYEADREMMLSKGSEENIRTQLSLGKPFMLTFRRLNKDKVSFCEIKFVAARKENGIIQSIGFGLTYKDNEIMAQYLNEKLISEYSSAFLVNLDDDRYRIYRHPDTTKAMDREDRVWSLAMGQFATECAPEFQELVSSLGSPAFLRSELANVDRREYMYRFPSSSRPWRRCVVIVIDRKDNVPYNILVTFMSIDDFQSKIKDQEAQLKQQLEMIGGLASGYHALYYFNLAKQYFKLYSVDKNRFPEIRDIIGKNANPIDIFRSFGQSDLVYPDDRYLFENITVTQLLNELSHKKKLTKRFRRKFGDDFLWTEMDIIKYEDIDESPNTIVLGFAERDKEIRREREAAIAQDLANQQRHIKVFGDMINAGLWSMDIQGKDEIIAVDWSDEFRHMLGYENENDFPNVLASWYELLHDEDKERTLYYLRNAIRSEAEGLVYDISYRILRKTGEYCWYHAVAHLEINHDRTRRLFGIITDISADMELARQKAQLERDITIIESQQEQLQEALSMAQSANRAKTTFLNNMSHDIRTPMNAIIGFTNLAKGHLEDSGKVMDYLNKIGQSSDHLLSLINDVLDMSRIESGKMNLEEHPEDLSEIIRTLRDICQADMQAKQHKFLIETVDIRDNNVICDRLRLNQVLLNIISNSIKYTPAGGTITMRITEKAVRASGYALYEFRIKDNGMGMSKEYLQMIFEPFTRVKSTTVSGIQGTGLGMAITKNIVDIMNGKIEIDSQIGKGTETVVTFDFRLAADKDSSAGIQSDDRPVDFSGIRILLVEDNELNREIATAILEEMGCTVFQAQDGDIAVEMIRDGKDSDYDMVLMDIQMPNLNGYDATRQIRDLNTPLSRIPIIAMTANAFEEDRKAALEAGMDEHLAKPVNPDQLSAMLAKFIKKD